MSGLQELNAPLFDEHLLSQFPMLPAMNELPLASPFMPSGGSPFATENPLAPIMKDMEEAMMKPLGTAFAPSAEPHTPFVEPVISPTGPQETGRVMSRLGNFFRKLMSRSPNSTLNVIKVKKDIDLKTGIVNTKVDENVFQMQPDGHLKKLFRIRLASNPTHIDAAPEGKPELLGNQFSFGAPNQVSNFSSHSHLHPEVHHAKPIHHKPHFAHPFVNHGHAHPHGSRIRSFGFGMAVFFLLFAMIYAGFRVFDYVRRKRASKEYMMVYNQENDSLAQVSYNANQELSSV